MEAEENRSFIFVDGIIVFKKLLSPEQQRAVCMQCISVWALNKD